MGLTAPPSPLVSFSMAGDFPPKSDDDLTGIVRGDIGEPLPLSSPNLAPLPGLVASLPPWQSPLRQASLAALPRAVSPAPLSPWESPLRQAVNASQNASPLRGSSARGLPSGAPTRAAEPEKPVTPGFAVWRSPAMFGSPRVQSDAEAPSPPVVSGVQEGLVRRATQTASRAILGAGAVDGLLATRNEKKPTPREPWQEPLVAGSTCPGKTNTMEWISSLARGDASGSCGCSPCQGGSSIPETRKDFVDTNLRSGPQTINSHGNCSPPNEPLGVVFKNEQKNHFDLKKYVSSVGKNIKNNGITNRYPNKQAEPVGGTESYRTKLLNRIGFQGAFSDSFSESNIYFKKNVNGRTQKIRAVFSKKQNLDANDGQEPKMHFSERKNVNETFNLWQGGVIYYYFDDLIHDPWPTKEKNIVRIAMSEWEDLTNGTIQFKESVGGIPFYYYLDPGTTSGSPSVLNAHNVDEQQFFIYVRHELGHVIGLGHEHQRTDVDSFIFRAHVPEGNEYNKDYGINGQSFGLYNARSIMHYYTFLKECLIKEKSSRCFLCLPIWMTGDENTAPNRIFCPTSFNPNAAFDEFLAIYEADKNIVIPNLKASTQIFNNQPTVVLSAGYLPNQPYTLIRPSQTITLLDGSSAVEMYRWVEFGIAPFIPLFGDYLTNGDEISNADNAKTNFLKNTTIWGAPAVAKNEQGDVYFVVTGTNNELYVKEKKWTQWLHIPIGAFSEPAAICLGDNLYIFVVDVLGNLRACVYMKKQISQDFYASKISSIYTISGVKFNNDTTSRYLARPSVVSVPAGLQIFVYSAQIVNGVKVNAMDDIKTCLIPNLYFMPEENQWQNVVDGTFKPSSAPSAAVLSDGKLIVTVAGEDSSSMGEKYIWVTSGIPQNDGQIIWEDEWTYFPGQVHMNETNPSIGTGLEGKFAIYVRGKYGHLFRKSYSPNYKAPGDVDGWINGWWDIGGILASDPSVMDNKIFALMGGNLEDSDAHITSDPSIKSSESIRVLNIVSTKDIKTLNVGIWYKVDNIEGKDPSPLDFEGGGLL